MILDEVGLRRFSGPPDVMYAQLNHVIKIAETHARVTVRVLPLVTGMAPTLTPGAQLITYTSQTSLTPLWPLPKPWVQKSSTQRQNR